MSGRYENSIGASGKIIKERYTKPLTGVDDVRGHFKHSFLFSQSCPVNLLGRNLMCGLGIGFVSTPEGVQVERQTEDSFTCVRYSLNLLGLRVAIATIWHIGGLWWPRDTITDLFSHTSAFVVICVIHLFPVMYLHLLPIVCHSPVCKPFLYGCHLVSISQGLNTWPVSLALIGSFPLFV